jgi:hypothetical protein
LGLTMNENEIKKHPPLNKPSSKGGVIKKI